MSSIPFPMQLHRLNRSALTDQEVFTSMVDILGYVQNGAAYPGQVIAFVPPETGASIVRYEIQKDFSIRKMEEPVGNGIETFTGTTENPIIMTALTAGTSYYLGGYAKGSPNSTVLTRLWQSPNGAKKYGLYTIGYFENLATAISSRVMVATTVSGFKKMYVYEFDARTDASPYLDTLITEIDLVEVNDKGTWSTM